ncbi:MAG: hypothetical protein KDD49_00515 [Bacteroidetes bacterium]|nr:hypothetical protein [Bacteroidota bacterium]
MKVEYNILLIVKDVSLLRLLSYMLKSNDYNIKAFSSITNAAFWIEKNLVSLIIIEEFSHKEFSLSDFLLGLNSSGIMSNIPLILIKNSTETIDNRHNLSIKSHLSKPINPVGFLTEVKNTLSKSSLHYA